MISFKNFFSWSFLTSLLLAGCTTLGIPTPEPAPYPYQVIPVCLPDGGEELLARAWPARHGILLIPRCPGEWTVYLEHRTRWGAIWRSLLWDVQGGSNPQAGEATVAVGIPSPNGLLRPPHLVLRHEIYHLLGCGHAVTRAACYQTIAEFKRR